MIRNVLRTQITGLALFAGLLAAVIGTAHAAEKIVNVEFQLNLTYPDTKQTLKTRRLSKTSWGSMKICEEFGPQHAQKQGEKLQAMWLRNSKGTTAVVSVAEWRCVKQ